MSRSGYTDDVGSQEEQWALIRWRGAVNSALRGRRGQEFLMELRDALDAMPEKKLYADGFKVDDGCFCALGVVANSRGIDMSDLEPSHDFEFGESVDSKAVGERLHIAPAMAREIMWENDEFFYYSATPEQRWKHMRAWAEKHISEPPQDTE